MSTVINQSPYLRTSRQFPNEMQALVVELNKAYIDTALAVNARTISIFPTNKPAVTGETWFSSGFKQQTLRQVYTFTAAGAINHGITSGIAGFTKIYGTFTNGTNWYPLPYVDVAAANNQVNVIVTPTQIIIAGGGGGGQPAIVSGYVVIEWLSDI